MIMAMIIMLVVMVVSHQAPSILLTYYRYHTISKNLAHYQPAIDGQDCPGYITCFVGDEESDGVRYILAGSPSFQRNALIDLLQQVLRQVSGQVGGDKARRDSVDRDLTRRDLTG